VIDSDTIVRCQGNKRKIRILLVTSDSKRIDSGNMKTTGIDWSKFDIRKAVEGLNKNEKAERLGQIEMIKKLQKNLYELKNTWEIIKRQKKEERKAAEMQRERKEEETDRWIKEYYKKNEEEKRKREEKEEQKRVDNEWEKIEKMRIKEERRVEKEWRKQEEFERRREERRIRVIEERKCFECRGFGHVAHHCRKMGEEEPEKMPLNKF